MTDSTRPFGTWAKIYRDLGLSPRPLKYPGADSRTGKLLGKACKERGWQLPDSELPPGTVEKWDAQYGHYNIGLLMGTPLPDGTLLGALDIDHDQYVPLGRALLGNPSCGRVGKKGAVYFVRFTPLEAKVKYKVKGEQNAAFGQVAEFLLQRTLCVIPPSIHPDIEQPYRWIGTPLHEMDFNQLPLIGE
ncbi:MAG: bifunctional DNA primase/polymerase [Alphaproteobacteria bacterium]|nr:bifunctional DNA primase/polymerase [Alphaproteobacteria bacterium]